MSSNSSNVGVEEEGVEVSSISIDVEEDGTIIGGEEEISSLVHFELFSFLFIIFFVIPLVRKEEVEGEDDKEEDDKGDVDKVDEDKGEDDTGDEDKREDDTGIKKKTRRAKGATHP